MAEWNYNTNQHMSTKLSPFEATYGYLPPRLPTYEPGTALVAAVDVELWDKEKMLALL